MLIVVLHGFNSAGNNEKSQRVREYFPECTVISPTYPPDPDQAYAILDAAVRPLADADADGEIIFIGTSLGAFWARYLAHIHNGKAVAINPAIDPTHDLQVYLGENTNYRTQQTFTLTPDMLARYGRYYLGPQKYQQPTLVLLNAGDELFDYRVAQQFYENRARVIVYPGGDHRFSRFDEALPEIRLFCNRMQL